MNGAMDTWVDPLEGKEFPVRISALKSYCIILCMTLCY